MSGSWRRDTNNKKKTLLCENIIKGNHCDYGKTCKFAHRIEDQILDPTRERTLGILFGNTNLSGINLIKDKQLLEELYILCVLCKDCKYGRCSGGKNCKHGAFNEKFLVCKRDINKGDCPGCKRIHLTDRGLVPYGIRVAESRTKKTRYPKPIVITDEYFDKESEFIRVLSKPNTENKIKYSKQFDNTNRYITANRIDNLNSDTIRFSSRNLLMSNYDSDSSSEFNMSDSESEQSLDTYWSDAMSNSNKELLTKSIFQIPIHSVCN
jgi:hypothetical protein